MPALDALVADKATHILDRNKHVPVKTLCGQAIDKDTTHYFGLVDNFNQSTCKVCRNIFFDESWSDDNKKSEPKNNTGNTRKLFHKFQIPVNDHSKKEEK